MDSPAEMGLGFEGHSEPPSPLNLSLRDPPPQPCLRKHSLHFPPTPESPAAQCAFSESPFNPPRTIIPAWRVRKNRSTGERRNKPGYESSNHRGRKPGGREGRETGRAKEQGREINGEAQGCPREGRGRGGLSRGWGAHRPPQDQARLAMQHPCQPTKEASVAT